MKCLTIDEAILILLKAKQEIGGDKTLILSQTDSELEDKTIMDVFVINDNESKYVEFRT